MFSRHFARGLSGAVARTVAAAIILFILVIPVVPVIALGANPPSPVPTVNPIGGGGGGGGGTSGATCDTKPQLPPGIPNMIVPNLPIEACNALGWDSTTGSRGLVDGYATLMTFLAFASCLWLLFIIGKLAYEFVLLFLGKKDEYGENEDKAGALFGHFVKQLIASFIVAVVGLLLFSNGIQVVLALGNGTIGILGVSSSSSYLLKFGGPIIGKVLLWMQNAGSMVLLLVAVPIAAFRFLRAYSKITLGDGGAAPGGGDFAAINAHLKSTFIFLVAIALCWVGIRFGIDLTIGLWSQVMGGGGTTASLGGHLVLAANSLLS